MPESLPRPTLRQVAALSGVSIKTVSRVMNGEKYVQAETADKVRRAAAQLGFRRNLLARDLRSQQGSTSVGLLIGDLANPFYSRIARGAERELRPHGLRLLTASTEEDPQLERSLAQEMLDRRVGALLIVPSSDDHTYLEVDRRHGLPVVFIDRPPCNILADTILLDNVGGARTATEHILARGHRRIAFIGDLSTLSTHRDRMTGFAQALEAAMVTDWRHYMRSEASDVQIAERSVHELMSLELPPTALFTTNNRITTGALRAVRDLNAPPLVVGFDDFELSDVLGVTVVQHDPEQMGALAARAAVERLGAPRSPYRTTTMPTSLLVRDTPDPRATPPAAAGTPS